MSNILSQSEMLAMSAPDIATIFKIGGGLASLAVAGFSAFKAYVQIPERHVGIRTFNGRATDRDDNRLHDLLLPGGHWILPFLHEVDLINLQHEVMPVATTFDIKTSMGKEQYNIRATATWGVLVDTDDDPEEAFEWAYNYYYGLDEQDDVRTKVGSRVERHLVECATELTDDNRAFKALASLATERLDDLTDLHEYGVGVREIELNAFHLAGVIQFGGAIPALLP
jgi:regulator of protease activity HflC (stomatin/prohibitin superfamily)